MIKIRLNECGTNGLERLIIVNNVTQFISLGSATNVCFVDGSLFQCESTIEEIKEKIDFELNVY